MAPKSQKQKSSGDRKNSKRSKPKPILPESEEAETLNMESMGHPEIYPLVLTTQTQEIFNCRIDEDVTDEQPYKLIKKEDIFADFQNRAAVSDFYPVRKVIQEYPGDELLVVYDKDFRYGLNFYLIGTEEGKENYLNPPEIAEEQEDYKEHIIEDLYVYRPPVSKPWVSLGSEKEIEEESVKESTKQITYMISRKRSKFGAPIKFSDQNASSVKDAYIECTAYPDRNFTLKQLEKDVGMQVVPKVKDTSTQTRWTYPKNATTQYYPREFSEEEKEIFGQSKTLSDFLNNVSVSVEIALQQNEIMNTFVDDWKCLAEEESTFGDKTDTHLKEYQSFTDLHNLKEKMVTSVSWHPTIYGLIAVSVAVRLSLEERVHFSGKLLLQPSLILFWSFSDPIHPQLMLESPDDIFCFKFCPSDPNIIAGGCINGQIVMWDITAHADRIENIKTGGSRSKKATLKPMFLLEPDSNKEATYIRHCAVSSIENGHKKVITDIHWLPDTFEINRMGSVFENRSGICCQLVTCSADCTICFWDIRPQKALTPQSVEKKKEENIEIPFDVPSTFLHLDLSWKPLIKIRLSKGETSLDHCPTKLSLNEDSLCKSQDKVLLAQSKTVKAGEMNPYYNLEGGLANHLKPIEDFCTKFFVGTEEGGVIYTDWKMERDSETGRLMAKQQFIAIADYYGTLHILEIPWTLSHPSTNEVSSMNYYFEREVKHLEYIEQRKKIRDQEKKEMELELEKKKTKTYQKSKEQLEAELKMDYESYLELEETTLINLGFLKVAEKMSFMDL
ncbi:dynein intermediate chain 3, axonemal isoform X5 [Canis lupus familiaris]|uniref:dynein intermediate chain 3, axonemal isoform X5 n=1 Tax=Canis lupus familiaris TaxID=9615 RepID=UPI0003AE4A94|nr:dynein intermediate chain 3, axonemal isoform X5 [Canis lupus familiaris]XP_025273579.1 dynein axonemal intermediate chain 3 isoform X5 [Canis lupus dingo]XP_038397439.1 dynein intermediate chain 3, axonemal isoform X5 [Canis lupus familiaris]XP_038526184.1 dynein intermediate chain 3, axonemal isoform X5 [Canis lupus familiaris]|eukprot:XP_005622048.1 WD repeat-containing protein 63 isoform X5 [Canis lupus familiaris]